MIYRSRRPKAKTRTKTSCDLSITKCQNKNWMNEERRTKTSYDLLITRYQKRIRTILSLNHSSLRARPQTDSSLGTSSLLFRSRPDGLPLVPWPGAQTPRPRSLLVYQFRSVTLSPYALSLHHAFHWEFNSLAQSLHSFTRELHSLSLYRSKFLVTKRKTRILTQKGKI